jgi:hypothetical protein
MARQFCQSLSVLGELGEVDFVLNGSCFGTCEPVARISGGHILTPGHEA